MKWWQQSHEDIAHRLIAWLSHSGRNAGFSRVERARICPYREKHDGRLGEIPREMRDYDLCMIDLLGIGYSRCTAEREMALKQVIQSRPALIFIPPGSGGGWLNSVMLQDCQVHTAAHCLTVQHPISTTILREAMKDLHRQND